MFPFVNLYLWVQRLYLGCGNEPQAETWRIISDKDFYFLGFVFHSWKIKKEGGNATSIKAISNVSHCFVKMIVIWNANAVQQPLWEIFFRRIHWNFKILIGLRAKSPPSYQAVRSGCTLPWWRRHKTVAVTEMGFACILAQGQGSHWWPSFMALSPWGSISPSSFTCLKGSCIKSPPSKKNIKKGSTFFPLKQVL